MAYKNNLIRMAITGAKHGIYDAPSLLDDSPWLKAHIQGDDLLLLDALIGSYYHRGTGAPNVRFDSRLHENSLSLAQWLDGAGVDIWTRNEEKGLDAFDLAVRCGCSGLVAWMGQHERRPKNLLERATVFDRPTMDTNASTITALAKIGFDPNATDAQGNSALHFARDPECVTALMQAGAKPDLKNKYGKDAVAYWDDHRVGGVAERKAMHAALAKFEKPDPDRAMREFVDLVHKQGIGVGMTRLADAGLDIATARVDGFAMPELMAARALDYGLVKTPGVGLPSIKDVSQWIKKCGAVLNHYTKAGGELDAGVLQSVHMLYSVVEFSTSYCNAIRKDYYSPQKKIHSDRLRAGLNNLADTLKGFHPSVEQTCEYLDRMVDGGVMKAGSLVSYALGMQYPFESGEYTPAPLVERAMAENWDPRWNEYRSQRRGVLTGERITSGLAESVGRRWAQATQSTTGDNRPDTVGAMALALLIDYRSTENGIRHDHASVLLDLVDNCLNDDGSIVGSEPNTLQAGCIRMIDGWNRDHSRKILDDDQFARLDKATERFRARLAHDQMLATTMAAPTHKRPGNRF